MFKPDTIMSITPNTESGGTMIESTDDQAKCIDTNQSTTYHKLCMELDEIVVNYIELVQQYKQIQSTQLHPSLQSGVWNITELRHTSSYMTPISTTNQSMKILSSDAYVDREEINAMYTIKHDKSSNQFILNHRTDLSTIDSINSVINDMNDYKIDDDTANDDKSIQSVLMQRKSGNKQNQQFPAVQNNNDAKSTASIDTNSHNFINDNTINNSDNNNNASIATITKPIQNPIKWFTSLKTNYMQLQKTQSIYQSTLHIIIQLASIQLQLKQYQQQYMKLKQHIDNLSTT